MQSCFLKSQAVTSVIPGTAMYMALILSTFSPPFSSSSLRPSSYSSTRCLSSSSSASIPINPPNTKLMEFPYLPPSQRDVMVDVVSKVESHLASSLLPCTLPPDVQFYENQSSTAHAALHIRSGLPSSQIDFILGSWIHYTLPSGGDLNITTLLAYLNTSTDAPNFVVELIQSSPISLILIIDLPPRKDLVLHGEYLKTFYEDTQLDKNMQHLEKLIEVQPYFSPSLFVRSVFSPAAVMVRIETGNVERLEKIVRSHVSPIAKEVLQIWLDLCVGGERQVGEEEKVSLAKRDKVVKSMSVEIDLVSNLPRMFGEEVANRVIKSLQEVL